MRLPVDFKTNNNGYEYLDYVGNNTLHSGRDFNYGSGSDDYGLPTYAISDAEVVYIHNYNKYNKWDRWGNVIVLYLPKYGVWCRYAHLKDVNVKVGDKLKESDIVGHIGGTGRWVSHLHFDIVLKKIPTWLSYTKNWSKYKVQEYYADPEKWIEEMKKEEESQKPSELPEIAKWCKKMNIISKWSQKPSDDELRAGYIAYKTLWHALPPAKRKKLCTIKEINKTMPKI